MKCAQLAAALLLAALLVPCAAAQYAVGVRDVAWPNTSGLGAATLTARVHYPAATAGTNTPVLPRAGGWPVVVFLHGFASPGTLYGALGDAWASRGFAVVVSTTSTFDNVGQEHDGRALFAAVVAAAGSGPFAAAFDAARIALAGHSMGGGNVGNVLADNPGYRCGLAIAPVAPRGGNAALVTAPVGIVAGEGDAITPWQSFAEPYFQGLVAVDGLRCLYLLDGDASHTNVAGLFVSGGAGAAVFERVVEFGAAFVAHWCGLSVSALEGAIGPAARSEPRLVALQVAVTTPQLWLAAPLQVGAAARVSVAAEPGYGGVAAAFALGPPTPTPLGELRLDPATAFLAVTGAAGPERRLDAAVAVPNDPSFAGVQLALQAFGTTTAGALRLGNAIATAVQ